MPSNASGVVAERQEDVDVPGPEKNFSSQQDGPRTETETRVWAALSAEPQTTEQLARDAGVGKSTAGKALARWSKNGAITRTTGPGPRHPALWSRPETGGQHGTAHAPEAVTEPGPTEAQVNGVETDSDGGADEPLAAEPGANATAHTAPESEETPLVSDGPEAGTTAETAPESAEAPLAVDVPEADPGASQEAAPPERLAPGALHGLVEDFLREHPGQEFGPSQIGKALHRSSGAVNNALEKMTTKGVVVKTREAPKRFSLAGETE
ncbi:hypothetical protein [Saccharopolyspora cebuensis]|uniref:hypothetical protein n=1 Tax=Saccharopolyspora cebuensis TaxID=418759 RepID=UPI0031EEEF17